MRYRIANCWATFSFALTVVAGLASLPAQEVNPEYPPLERVTEGYNKIVSTADGRPSFYTLWKRDRDNQLLAEIPKDFARQKHFIALTVSSGDEFAGLQSGDMYVYWRQYGNRMALIAPNLDIRSTGDNESRSSVRRLFTDTVLLDVPIVTMVPRGGPVIDLDEILVRNATVFFGDTARTGRPQLAEVTKVKAFPENIEIAIELPAADGHLQTLSYSISLIPENTGYQPRRADERVGYFVTSYRDLGQYDADDVAVRFINRWHLEKRDPSLRVSPPKKPIVFYLEHTTPVRYRRWVREGVEFWNTAFERVGISNAIEVYYQDAESGAYMDLDPEDVRYNFIRWLNNDIGTAIGPSRVNPMTGQILDADIVLTDGWIRHFETQFTDVMPKIAMEGMNSETLAWLADHPSWDPRVRLAHPADRARVEQEIALSRLAPYAGDEMANVRTRLMGDDAYDGLIDRVSQVNGMCMAAEGRSYDMAVLRMMMTVLMMEGEAAPDEPMLDGIPESFIGPLLADLVAHEVGHTLGLRHNFKASSIYTLDQINGEVKGKPFAGSVMDYLPINYRLESGTLQGDFGMTGLGPYDFWAIEYGYTFDGDLSKVLARVAEPELVYATDEDTGGPDPLARRYDFSRNPIDFAKEQVRLALHNRAKIMESFVQDGQSWSRARTGYELTLRMQTSATSMMAGWIGGTHVNRDKKGDPNGRAPLEVVPVDQQRAALAFILETTFRDGSYGLTPELLRHMTMDRWLDEGRAAMQSSPAWPIHDRIMGIQASTLTQLMNPSTLQGVYDNEFRVAPDQDALTLPELMQTIRAEIWTELGGVGDQQFTARAPAISSLRRNLQREHLERLVDLMLEGGSGNAATKPIATLALSQLQSLKSEIDTLLANAGERLDPYSRAHLQDASLRISKAVDAGFIYNASTASVGGNVIVIAQPAPGQPAGYDMNNLIPAGSTVTVAPTTEAGVTVVPAAEPSAAGTDGGN